MSWAGEQHYYYDAQPTNKIDEEILRNLDPQLRLLLDDPAAPNTGPLVDTEPQRPTRDVLINRGETILSATENTGDAVSIARGNKNRKLPKVPIEEGKSRKRPAVKPEGYPCEHGCLGKLFGRMGDAKRHHKEVHGVADNGDKVETLPCPDKGCGRHKKPFTRQRNLEEHVAKFHKHMLVQFASQAPFQNDYHIFSAGQGASGSVPPRKTSRKRNWQTRSSNSPDVVSTQGENQQFESSLLQTLRELKKERDAIKKSLDVKEQQIERLEVVLVDRLAKYETAAFFVETPWN